MGVELPTELMRYIYTIYKWELRKRLFMKDLVYHLKAQLERRLFVRMFCVLFPTTVHELD